MTKKRSKNTYEPRDEDQPAKVKLGEALAVYQVTPLAEEVPMSGITRLSSKYQITLPAGMVRQLGLRPGDELNLLALNGTITLERRPDTPEGWANRLAGALSDYPEWGSDEAIHTWIRREREGWERPWDEESKGS
jgi:AbrB family looped-hinge helix DNA binding protein